MGYLEILEDRHCPFFEGNISIDFQNAIDNHLTEHVTVNQSLAGTGSLL